MFSKKLWIALISCCCIGSGIALACAGGDWDEYGVSNFAPEVFVDSAYSPFFYSDQFYYKINHDEEQRTRFNESNIKEWSGWFKTPVNHSELQYLLQTASDGAVDSVAKYIAGKTAAVPVSMKAFALLKQKNNKQVIAFLNYLQLAKQCEEFSLDDIPFFWSTDSVKKTTDYHVTPLNRNLLTAFATKDIFLKERYWFQLIRLYFFNGKPQQAITLFNTGEKDMPHNNTMYFRSMAYTAGAYHKLKNYSKANYYYSKIYDNCIELKVAAHYSFHPQEEKDWNATLGLCANNDEKATLWQMVGIFYTDEQRAIDEIYKLNPASNKLDLLLARAVNKYEQKFDYQNGYSFMPPIDSNAASTVPALINKIAAAGNTSKPWIWQMAAGYVSTLDQHYNAAFNWFDKAAKTIPAQKEAQAQLRLLKLINTVAASKQIDDKLEKNILADIDWLRTFDSKAMPDLRYADAFGWLKQKMAKKYRQQNDWVKAECFFSSSVFYTNNKNVEDLKALFAKANKTPYEKLCTDLSDKKAEDLYEFQAVRLTFADSLDAAIEKMEKAGNPAKAELLGNPFNGRIQDCHDCDHAAPQKIKYSSISFLKKIQEIKSKINAGEEVYTNAILLANAHYNITYYGNARMFYDSKILGSSDSNSLDSVFNKMLTGMGMATKYYTLALKSAATEEQRAKCQYMLAKCQRNQWYNEGDGKNANGKEVDFLAWDGFKALKQYSNTQYYKDVIKECGFFKTYTSKH